MPASKAEERASVSRMGASQWEKILDISKSAIDAAKAEGYNEAVIQENRWKLSTEGEAYDKGWHDAIAASKCHDATTCPDCTALVEKGRAEKRGQLDSVKMSLAQILASLMETAYIVEQAIKGGKTREVVAAEIAAAAPQPDAERITAEQITQVVRGQLNAEISLASVDYVRITAAIRKELEGR